MWSKDISKGKVWQRPLLGLLVWQFLSRKSIILIPKTLSVLLPTAYFGSQNHTSFVTKALRSSYGKYHSLNIHVFFLLIPLKKLLPLLGRAFRALCCLNGDWNMCRVWRLLFLFISWIKKPSRQSICSARVECKSLPVSWTKKLIKRRWDFLVTAFN